MDCSLPGSPVHRILQARIPEWVAIPFSRASSWPSDLTLVSCIAGDSSPSEPPVKPDKKLVMLVKEYGGEEPQASVGKSGEVGEWEIHPGYHVFRPIKLTDFNNYSTLLSQQEALSHQALHGELRSRPRGPSSIWKDSNLLSTLGLLWKTSHVDRRFIHWQNATSILKICLHQLQRTATVMNFQMWQWEMSLCFAWM